MVSTAFCILSLIGSKFIRLDRSCLGGLVTKGFPDDGRTGAGHYLPTAKDPPQIVKPDVLQLGCSQEGRPGPLCFFHVS